MIAARELPAPRAQVDQDELRAALDSPLGEADAVGHRIVHGGERFRSAVRIDAEVESGAARAVRPRAASPAEVARGARCRHARRCRTCPRSPALTPPFTRHCRRRRDLCAAGAVARALGPAPLRLSRPLARLGRAAHAAAAGARCFGAADRELSPRRRRVAVRDQGRSLGRHDDGLHAARGPGDGDPLGQRRSGDAAVAAGARAAVRRASWPTRSSTAPVCSAWRAAPTCARSSTGAGTGEPAAAPGAWMSTSTGCAPGSPRWRRRSAASTCSCSPAVSASTRREVRARSRSGPRVSRCLTR